MIEIIVLISILVIFILIQKENYSCMRDIASGSQWGSIPDDFMIMKFPIVQIL